MRILHVALNGEQKQLALEKALRSLGKYKQFDWLKARGNVSAKILKVNKTFKPDLTFMQLQTPNILRPSDAAKMGGFVVNWTGDVREPLPPWYIEVGREIDLTLFTNTDDVKEAQHQGVTADYLQIGFDPDIFRACGYVTDSPDIAFMANNYGSLFPLSERRRQIVNLLRGTFGDDFAVYGTGWGALATANLNGNHEEEANVYRGSFIGINHSHFEKGRYSSDRIFRIMGCGALCVTHEYPGIHEDFEDGVHLVTYATLSQLIYRLKKALENPLDHMDIALNGCDYVHNNCTWQHRIDELVTLCKKYGF